MKYFLVAFVLISFFGCQKNENLVEISKYEFDQILGHNAAVMQFGTSDMYINTKNFKVNHYLKYEEDDDGYTNGYHRALETISSQKNKNCPYIY